MVKDFFKPATAAEAIALLERLGERACYLGGGTEVNAAGFPGPIEYLISLEGLGLDRVEDGASGLAIGAGCTLQRLLDAPGMPRALVAAVRQIAYRNIRNAATVGGTLAGTGRWGTLAPALIALGARVEVAGPRGAGTLAVLEYLAAARRPLVTRILVPRSDPRRRTATASFALTANDVALVSAAAALARDGERVVDPVVAAGGAGWPTTRLAAVEDALRGHPLPARDELERRVAAEVDPPADHRGSAAYRKHLAGSVVAQAVLDVCHGGAR